MAGAADLTWWQRLGGPNAVSLPAWLLTLPGAILTTPTLSEEPRLDDLLLWFALGAIAHVLCGMVLFIAWLTVLPPTPRPSRPWIYVLTVVLAGVLRGLFLGVSSTQLGLADDMNLQLRLIAAPFTLLLWLSFATLIVDGSRCHRQAMTELRRALARERELVEESAGHLRQYRDTIVAQVTREVTTQLQGAAGLTADPTRAAAYLNQTVQEVVRPLSHTLEQRTVQEDQLVDEVAQGDDPGPLPMKDYVEAAATTRPFSPLLTTALVLGSSTILTLYTLGPLLGVICLVLNLGVILATTIAFAELLRSSPAGPAPARHPWRRVPIVLLSYAAIAAIAGLAVVVFAVVTSSPSLHAVNVSLVAVLITVALVAMASQLASAANSAVDLRRKQSEEDLRSATYAVERASSRLRQRAFLDQQQLSRMLHGTVQARIVSVALMLQLNPPPDPAATIAELDRSIREALGEDGGVQWRDQLNELDGLWAHVIDLDVDVTPAAARRLDADGSAAQAAVSVISEAVTNAVRHGGADQVSVAIGLGGGFVMIDVTDDGDAPPEIYPAGMGTRLFDSLCFDWELDLTHGGHLRALIETREDSAAGAEDDAYRGNSREEERV